MSHYICLKCDYIGKPKRMKRGSTQLEVLGWLLFPLGIPYTLWRMLSKKPVCKYCDNEYLIHPKSTLGQQYQERKMGDTAIDCFGGTEKTPKNITPQYESLHLAPPQTTTRTQDPNEW